MAVANDKCPPRRSQEFSLWNNPSKSLENISPWKKIYLDRVLERMSEITERKCNTKAQILTTLTSLFCEFHWEPKQTVVEQEEKWYNKSRIRWLETKHKLCDTKPVRKTLCVCFPCGWLLSFVKCFSWNYLQLNYLKIFSQQNHLCKHNASITRTCGKRKETFIKKQNKKKTILGSDTTELLFLRISGQNVVWIPVQLRRVLPNVGGWEGWRINHGWFCQGCFQNQSKIV